MNKNLTKLLSLLLILSVSLAVYGILSKKTTYLVTFSSNKSVNKVSRQFDELKVSFWDMYPQLVIASDGRKLDEHILVKDVKGNTHRLSQLLGNKTRLVFRYSVRDCDICVDSIFSILDKYKRSQKLTGVIILTDSYSERDFILKMKYTKAPFTIYNIPVGGLDLPLENKNFPFLFLLDKDFKAVKFFTPFKEISGKTDEYLDVVLKDLKNENE